jgi:hypothetical protein
MSGWIIQLRGIVSRKMKRIDLPRTLGTISTGGFSFPSCLLLLRAGGSSSSSPSSSSPSSSLLLLLPEKSAGPRVSFSPSCCCEVSKFKRWDEVSLPLYVSGRFHGYLWIRTDIALHGDQVVPLHDDKNRTILSAKRLSDTMDT